jgi:hypothetical protein
MVENGVAGELRKRLRDLSAQELRELVMVNAYKLEMTRHQLDAVVDIMIRKKLTSYEEVWKRTQERFNEDDFSAFE